MGTREPLAPDVALHEHVDAFLAGLVAGGVRHLCLCPGSRSTPLAIEASRRPDLKVWVHLDERSCGYFATGIAQALDEPVAILCTSGTAAANFLPAVAEASHAKIPLVVITADRPPELRDVGAPQTMEQRQIYGGFAKRSVDLALVDLAQDLRGYMEHWGARLAALAASAPAGPVQCNAPFREPLIPAAVRDPRPAHSENSFASAARRPDPTELDHAFSLLTRDPRGIIVCGPQRDARLPAAVARLARALGFPILADPLSALRFGSHDRESVISAYDAFLRGPAMHDLLRPRLVLRLGAPPTSKALEQFLDAISVDAEEPPLQFTVADLERWNAPSLRAGHALAADPVAICEGLAELAHRQPPEADVGWIEAWRRSDAATWEAIDAALADEPQLSEPTAIRAALKSLPAGSTIFAGNSMPVRDLDTFAASSPKHMRLLGNRGVNGIDGVVSSALGVAAVSGGPLLLLIGDLSLYHDLNGLFAAKRHDVNATILMLNNDGGGIFSFLPQAESVIEFEELFGTPHGLSFAPAAELYGLGYSRPDSLVELRDAIAGSISSAGVQLIEVPTRRDENAALHRRIWSRVAVATAKALAPAAT